MFLLGASVDRHRIELMPFDPTAPKQTESVEVNSDLLEQAKARKIDLSQALEERLEELLRDNDTENWVERNRKSLSDYNRYVEKHGVFSDGLRRF